jgi:hypothetical protein
MIHQQKDRIRFIVYHVLCNDGSSTVKGFTPIQLAAFKRSKMYKNLVLHMTKLTEIEVVSTIKIHNLHQIKKL